MLKHTMKHTIARFSPKYLLEGRNANILPNEIKLTYKIEKLSKDRKLSLNNTMKSYEYNKRIRCPSERTKTKSWRQKIYRKRK